MLPKIDQPLFELTIPSTKQKVTFKPFTVKEEKLLLIAQESGDDVSIIKSMLQIVNNCVTDQGFNCETLATFDLEYAFLKIRAKSVNNIVKVAYKDNEDEEVYDFEIDIDELEIEIPAVDNKISVDGNIGIVMKYPPARIIQDAKEFENNIELMTFFIINCIDTVYDKAGVYEFNDYTNEEKSDFLDSLPVNAFDKIKDFFEAMPKLHHVIEYKNSLGNDRKIELNNIKDFFPWG